MLLHIQHQLPGKLSPSLGHGSLLQQLRSLIANKRVLAGVTDRKPVLSCATVCPSKCYHQNSDAKRLLAGRSNAPFYKCFSSSLKKEGFQIKSVEGTEILQKVLEKNRQLLQEKKNVIIQDIRERKEKVKERVEEVIERENVMTIPNLLCVGRIVLSPYLGYVIVQSEFSLAMGMLVVAGLTDLADGFIARNWPGQASRLGSFLDPMADKILVGSLVISMSCADLLPLWLSGMILFRDVFLIAAGFVIRYISLPQPRTLSRYFDVTHATAQLEPTFISKVNTAVQLATVAITLGAPIWSYVDHPYLHGLWYLTGVTTAAAALSYIINKDTYKILKKQSK
ncbi:probable cardiolipin synthase (CMP-forming) [Toxorhynchites rutilus septentrionalis]|uniref:probable cardiolipin synthase (CMP-forming) n=1 Tax=Toxorhynchites rutilus septentrionalis TaxID=329112 RepID=UPI00247AF954|nr:probable cardiolipin synthase (CMP-forming) [Toxorhynchites rutilus septentrionalis]XP_055615972.1 probable cardiolipin synthase (CMP-forming) [Toxorhynchites rutilus septentrionalis]XP_055615973.1 probable cardiolipin synthase (CMP-forming) [Toxorhynchites rutilus septentrionalis]XP_055615974.1 probable cardiolipin synthase (CMP-forming) [Toxorhynchites rutilus septentrionalis]